MRPQTILFQPPNHIGLGHVSRLLAIAQAVAAAEPAITIAFAVEGHGHGLIEAYGLPFVSLPPSGQLASLPRAVRRAVGQEIAAATLNAFAPDLVVFDCFPSRAMVDAAAARGIPAVLSLRQTLHMDLVYTELRRCWAQVALLAIAHAEGECEVPDEFRPRTLFAGPIVRVPPPGVVPHPPAPGSKLIVIAGGGGGYRGTVAFYNAALQAFAALRASTPEATAVLVTGPLFADWWHLHLVDGVRVVPFDPGFLALCASAHLVVCQAGYNTISELCGLGVPIVCVPGERMADDQFRRADAAARTTPGMQVCTEPSPDALAALMTRALRSPPFALPNAGAPDGARRVAARLLALLAAADPFDPGAHKPIRSLNFPVERAL